MSPIEERFQSDPFSSRLTWRNPPPVARIDPARGRLIVQPAAESDFWQRTHYGFQADNGHHLAAPVQGDVTVTTEVELHPQHQYDQAGVLLYADADCWVKLSLEYEPDEASKLGVVVTNNGFSDWSFQPFDAASLDLQFQLRRQGQDIEAAYRLPGGAAWTTIRVAHLACAPDARLACGLYACSPRAAGFQAEFTRLTVSSS